MPIFLKLFPPNFVRITFIICDENSHDERGMTGCCNLVPRAFYFRSAKMALASAGHITSKSPVFGVFIYDDLCV